MLNIAHIKSINIAAAIAIGQKILNNKGIANPLVLYVLVFLSFSILFTIKTKTPIKQISKIYPSQSESYLYNFLLN